MATVFGGDVNGIRVSLFGGGHAYYELRSESGRFVRFLAAFGGILVNIISGLLPFMFMRRFLKNRAWVFFLVLFGMVSLLGAISYCTLGFYYEQGDPFAWIEGPSSVSQWLWFPFLILCPFTSYIAIRSYSVLCDQLFPTRTFTGRFVMVVLTLGVAGCAYVALYSLAGQRLMTWDAPTLAYERAEHEVKKSKMEELSKGFRKSYPELSEAEIRNLIQRMQIVVKPEEIPKRFPLKPVIAGLFVLGAVIAIRRRKRPLPYPDVDLAPRHTAFAVIASAAVLGLLVWTDGWILGGSVAGSPGKRKVLDISLDQGIKRYVVPHETAFCDRSSRIYIEIRSLI
jgi:hypothetical protein